MDDEHILNDGGLTLHSVLYSATRYRNTCFVFQCANRSVKSANIRDLNRESKISTDRTDVEANAGEARHIHAIVVLAGPPLVVMPINPNIKPSNKQQIINLIMFKYRTIQSGVAGQIKQFWRLGLDADVIGIRGLEHDGLGDEKADKHEYQREAEALDRVEPHQRRVHLRRTSRRGYHVSDNYS